MLGWIARSLECAGGVAFPGTLPPRLENFPQLNLDGMTVQPLPADKGTPWKAHLKHPKWGEATVQAISKPEPIPDAIMKFDPRLTPMERETAKMGGCSIAITARGTQKNILRDRKNFLRFLNLFLGDDGVMAVDTLAQRFWSRDALADELMHDADVDVESLFTTHAVTGDEKDADGEPRCEWLHTHGLAELGTLDFDIIRPSPMILGPGYDAIRALAFNLLEKGKSLAGETFPIFMPGGEALLMPVEQFNRANPQESAVRGDPSDPQHNTNRVVLCDPMKKRLFGLLPAKSRPSRMLSTVNRDGFVTPYPTYATELMSQRAMHTLHLMPQFVKEFEEFEVKPLAKIGYVVDGGEPNDREHLWFEVNGITSEGIDATLLNEPHNIARFKAGQRDTHAPGKVTDWMIFTPVGHISPRDMTKARLIRENAAEIRKAMAARRKE